MQISWKCNVVRSVTTVLYAIIVSQQCLTFASKRFFPDPKQSQKMSSASLSVTCVALHTLHINICKTLEVALRPSINLISDSRCLNLKLRLLIMIRIHVPRSRSSAATWNRAALLHTGEAPSHLLLLEHDVHVVHVGVGVAVDRPAVDVVPEVELGQDEDAHLQKPDVASQFSRQFPGVGQVSKRNKQSWDGERTRGRRKSLFARGNRKVGLIEGRLWLNQGRNGVRWRPGQEASLAPPCSNLELFRKQMYCIEGSTCDIIWDFSATLLGLFGAPPQGFGAPVVTRPPGNCAPSLRPGTQQVRFTPGMKHLVSTQHKHGSEQRIRAWGLESGVSVASRNRQRIP